MLHKPTLPFPLKMRDRLFLRRQVTEASFGESVRKENCIRFCVTQLEKGLLIAFILVIAVNAATAQQAGTTSYSFLNMPYGAKIGGIGGVNISLYNNDPNLFLSNPALASDSLANRPTVNYTAFPTGIGQSSATYSHNFKKAGLWSAGVQYLSYGQIDGYDNAGNPLGSFNPKDYAVTISHVRYSNNVRFGASIKQVGSDIAGYKASATLFDLGGLFVHPSQRFTVGLTIKNVGFEWQQISETVSTKLPFDVQVGTSVKPLHMPFRFSFTFYNLTRWDLALPNEISTNAFADNLMRHVVIGAELIMGKHINILFGYNHLRKKELKLENAGGFSGFSLGLDIKTKAFELVYAYGGYNVAGNANMLTLSVDMNQLVK